MDEYHFIQARDEYLASVRADGKVVDEPANNQLQLDIDTREDEARFFKNWPIFKREIERLYHKELPFPRITPSRSGYPSQHVRIDLPFEVDTWQRIAWQGALGSDPTRELLSAVRALNGDDKPTLLVENPGF